MLSCNSENKSKLDIKCANDLLDKTRDNEFESVRRIAVSQYYRLKGDKNEEKTVS